MIGNALHVTRIATGEAEETTDTDDGKDKTAQLLGRKGGKARADKLTSERRREIAQAAARKRWGREED